MRNAFEIAKSHGYIKSANDMEVFHRSIIEHIISHEARGVKDQKYVWGSLNPMFFGIHYDRAFYHTASTKNGVYNLTDARFSSRSVNLDTITEVQSSNDKKQFVIPPMMSDYTGAAKGKYPVSIL